MYVQSVIDSTSTEYAHQKFNAHFLQLAYHGGGIGEEFRIKAVVTQAGPVEEIADDHVDGQMAALVLPCHGENLLLIPVAQLTLPEAQTVLRGYAACPNGGCAPCQPLLPVTNFPPDDGSSALCVPE